MPRIYSTNENYSSNMRGLEFINGVAATAVAATVAEYAAAGYTIDASADVLSVWDKRPKAELLQYAAEMDIPTTGLTKAQLVAAIEAVISGAEASVSPTEDEWTTGTVTDKTYDVDLNGRVLTNVKNGAAVLTPTTDYSFAEGVLTLKAAYLDTLAEGEAVITLNMNGGADPTITITVAAGEG